jgi:aryl-alcohol dehydrogenase-like predicted oxidoreductase
VTVSLGKTGLAVSRIGLGLAALGRPGYITLGHGADLAGDTAVEALRAHSHAVMDAAFDAGVRYFDAARSYGLAEDFLGSWLTARGWQRGDVTVGSKWGYTYTAGWQVGAEVNEVKDLSIETLRRQEVESRVLLGDTLALYQIHSATIESGVLDDAAVLDELARLRAGGLRIGFTSTGPRQYETIERAVATGHFDAVQATFNGRLTGRGDVPELIDAAAGLGVAPDALALAFVLAQPWVDVALSGASTVPMLLSNLTALDVSCDGTVCERLAGLTESPEEYWERRAALAWN